MKKAYLAGGCYWGMEYYLKSLNGVIETSVGFMGGDDQYKTYEDVKLGHTGHAEVVAVEYDEKKLSFEDLIIFFFRLHDPTTLNRQKNDVGTQYRSSIFTNDTNEIDTIKDIIEKIDKSNAFKEKIVTAIEPVTKYHKASELHQNYLIKFPNGYNCHILRESFDIFI